MVLITIAGPVNRSVTTTYVITVVKVDGKASVMMAPKVD